MGTARLLAIAAMATVASGCAFGNPDNPYRGLPDPPSVEQVLEGLNLASFGLRMIDCDVFDAPVSRCYEPDRLLGVREGRELLGQIHRELLAEGARYWGSSDSPMASGPLEVAGLNLGCYFDYQTKDYALRLAVVGPSGETEPCVNGLPGDGVRQVWIIGAPFSPESVYGSVVVPPSLDALLQFLPPRVIRTQNIYGGPDITMEGYYGPELPRPGADYGVHILAQTVSVQNGVVRGLVQYDGAAPTVVPAPEAPPGASPSPATLIPRETTGAVGIVVEVGNQRYNVPMAVRPGESAPFEITLPAGFDVTDLNVMAGWSHSEVDWKGGQRLAGPTPNPACGTGVAAGGANVAALVPSGDQVCLEFDAQATTAETWIRVDAIVATFAEDGTVAEVTTPYVLRGDGGDPGIGRVVTYSPNLRIAWLAPAGSEGSTGVWIHYAKRDEIAAASEQ